MCFPLSHSPAVILRLTRCLQYLNDANAVPQASESLSFDIPALKTVPVKATPPPVPSTPHPHSSLTPSPQSPQMQTPQQQVGPQSPQQSQPQRPMPPQPVKTPVRALPTAPATAGQTSGQAPGLLHKRSVSVDLTAKTHTVPVCPMFNHRC